MPRCVAQPASTERFRAWPGRLPSCSRSRQTDERIVAHRRDGIRRHGSGAPDGPFIVLMEQDGANGLVSALDFAVEALERIDAVQPGPVLPRGDQRLLGHGPRRSTLPPPAPSAARWQSRSSRAGYRRQGSSPSARAEFHPLVGHWSPSGLDGSRNPESCPRTDQWPPPSARLAPAPSPSMKLSVWYLVIAKKSSRIGEKKSRFIAMPSSSRGASTQCST